MTGKTIKQVDEDLQKVVILVNEHDKILVRGNGEPSLQENMRSIQKDVAEIKKYLEEEKATRAAYIKLFVGIIAGEAVALIASFFF